MIRITHDFPETTFADTREYEVAGLSISFDDTDPQPITFANFLTTPKNIGPAIFPPKYDSPPVHVAGMTRVTGNPMGKSGWLVFNFRDINYRLSLSVFRTTPGATDFVVTGVYPCSDPLNLFFCGVRGETVDLDLDSFKELLAQGTAVTETVKFDGEGGFVYVPLAAPKSAKPVAFDPDVVRLGATDDMPANILKCFRQAGKTKTIFRRLWG